MLDVTNAKEVISQLSTETFLCNENLISTNDYIIVKKTSNVTTDKVNEAIRKIIEEAKKNET